MNASIIASQPLIRVPSASSACMALALLLPMVFPDLPALGATVLLVYLALRLEHRLDFDNWIPRTLDALIPLVIVVGSALWIAALHTYAGALP